jgi:hypothetical protein
VPTAWQGQGGGLIGAAVAEDGVIEAVEAPERQFLLGVLQHAELSGDVPLSAALVGEAEGYKAPPRPRPQADSQPPTVLLHHHRGQRTRTLKHPLPPLK